MKITAVTTQKNEGAFLLEWIAYHKIIGFTDIVILSNDCEDGSDEMLDHLSKSGEIIHCAMMAHMMIVAFNLRP